MNAAGKIHQDCYELIFFGFECQYSKKGRPLELPFSRLFKRPVAQALCLDGGKEEEKPSGQI
jgi:hypothetical protein